MGPDHSRRGITSVLALAGLAMVVSRFHILVVTLVILAVIAWFFWPRRQNPEIASLRASLEISRADITDVLDAYDTLLHGTSADAIADRTLYYAALTEPDSTDPAIEEFFLRAASARRFVARIDAYLADANVSKASLERLLTITDERAAELAISWADARRSAKRLGPGR